MRSADDDESGRVLSDDEYMRALRNRDDIFLIERGCELRNILVVSLALGAIVSVWLSTMPAVEITPVFRESKPGERVAKLLRKRNAPATPQQRTVAALGRRAEHTEPRSVFRDNAGTYSFRLRSGLRRAGASADQANIVAFQPDTLPRAKDTTAYARTEAQPPVARPLSRQGYASVQDTVAAGQISLADQRADLAYGEDSRLVGQGNAFEKQGNHADASAAFSRVLRHDPHNAPALAGMGGEFLRIGLLDSAVASYSAAIALNPRVAAVHNGLGSARYFISTLAANPNYAERMNIHDPAHYIKAQYDSAIAEYTAAISLDSSCVDALTNRGVLRDIHDDHAGAIADYTLAIRTRPSYAEAYCKRAATYKTVGKYKQAIADYTAAIKLGSSSYEFDPTLHFANAYFSRGVAYYKTGDLGKAMADFDSTLVLSPRHSLAILSRAIALGDQKRYDSAIVGCTQAIALLAPSEYDGARELAYLQRGNAFRAKGEYDKAIADYTSALGSPKLAAKSCWRIADCYSLKHESATAIAWLRKSVSHGFSDFRAWKRDRDLFPLWNTREFRDIAG